MNSYLVQKYNIPVPRYTSYPTVPFWQKEPVQAQSWKNCFQATIAQNDTISLYIHLPYCESMCTFCGCNKRITKNHQVELPYIETLLQEWRLYLQHFGKKPVIKELHLGGGTPTFFQPEHLEYLVKGILKDAVLAEEHELGFEAHPNSTTDAHLETLYQLGFRRISVGVQDFDNEILKIINRQQSYETVARVTQKAKQLGYHSINFDLVFGLPLQTLDHIEKTIQKTLFLRPDRIAFYSYAHVPWVKPGQRAYSETDLPLGKEKRALYEYGRQRLEGAGYHEIGMDHFALSSDPLYQAKVNHRLHRNFMGYTPMQTDLMLGLGASAISDAQTAYVQNEKKIEDYQQKVRAGVFPIFRGHLLSQEDQIIRQHILELICHNQTDLSATPLPQSVVEGILKRLASFASDGLIIQKGNQIIVTVEGLVFIRNICTAFDQKLIDQQSQEQVFSQAV